MKVYSGADIYPAAHGGPHATSGGCTLKETTAQGEPIAEQAADRTLWRGAHAGAIFFGRTCDPAGDSHWNGLFLENNAHWKRPILE